MAGSYRAVAVVGACKLWLAIKLLCQEFFGFPLPLYFWSLSLRHIRWVLHNPRAYVPARGRVIYQEMHENDTRSNKCEGR